MAAMPVVVMQPGVQRRAPVVGVPVHAGIGLLEQRGLDKALDFAIRARRVAPRPKMPHPKPSAGGGEAVGLIAGPVVSHDSGHTHTQPPQAAHRPTQEADGGSLALVGQDLADGQTREIVDRHVRKLPSGAVHGVTPIAGHAMTGAHNPPEFLGIQMQQLARRGPLVAARRRRQLQHVQARPAAAADDPGNCRAADRKFKSPLAPPPAASAPTSPAGRGGPARAPRSQAERGLDRPRRMG